MGTEPFLQRGIDMVLKNTGQVDGIFFEVVEGADCIEKGSIVSLGAQCYGLIVGVNVALPNVVEDVVGFNRIAWYENPEKGIVNSFRGQANHQQLQFPVDVWLSVRHDVRLKLGARRS